MRLRRTILILSAIWLVLFLVLMVMTPTHYVEVTHTMSGGTQTISGDTNGGPLGVLPLSALRALFLTAIISVIAAIVGSISMGFKPFLARIGFTRSQP